MQKSQFKKNYKTPRLEIRPYKLSDYTAWMIGMSSRTLPVNKFDNGPLPKSKLTCSDFKNRVSRYNKAVREDQFYVYGLFDRKTGNHVGSIDLYIIQRNPMKWGNLGYQIHNHVSGLGYAKEAAKAALKIGFNDLGLHRIEAAMEKDHKVSAAVARSAGMKKEGIRKNFLPAKNGKWNDAFVFVAINKRK